MATLPELPDSETGKKQQERSSAQGWAILLAALLFMAGCSLFHKKDGPPPFPVNVSRIPDAIPKIEPKSRHGNYPVYQAGGKTWHVLASGKNYDQTGIASWYGTKFHAHLTSTRETYNMLAMTAAHRTLPLPTYAEVTNLHNGKKVIVKINDRGPFAPRRLIDLSWAAAKKLDMVNRGTARVRVRAISSSEIRHTAPPVPVLTHTAPLPDQNALFLQVGAFKQKFFAEQLRQRLAQHGVSSPASIHIRSTGKKPLLYRVEIGPLRGSLVTRLIQKRLEIAGISEKSLVRH